jgi:hypothetical protein
MATGGSSDPCSADRIPLLPDAWVAAEELLWAALEALAVGWKPMRMKGYRCPNGSSDAGRRKQQLATNSNPSTIWVGPDPTASNFRSTTRRKKMKTTMMDKAGLRSLDGGN